MNVGLLRIRWFGESWNPELCDPEYQIEPPTSTRCMECDKPIGERDRGLVAACSPSIWGHWRIEVGELGYSVCSYHLACFLALVENGKVEGTRVAERAYGAGAIGRLERFIESGDTEVLVEGLEDAESGRGWGRGE